MTMKNYIPAVGHALELSSKFRLIEIFLWVLTVCSTSDDEVDPVQDTPHKPKRKKKIYENTAARTLREQDRERILAQEERRLKLQANLTTSREQGDGANIIINESKLEEDGFIHVNQIIARRIKKHQIEGVRFMWNQVIGDVHAQQGCLLAHTMGLGKTMQVCVSLHFTYHLY